MYSYSFVDSITGKVKWLGTQNVLLNAPEGQTRINSKAPGLNYVWNFELEQWEDYIDPLKEINEALRIRNKLLTASDYTQLNDSTHPGTKTEWATYRQTLRDITVDSNWPNVTWPEKPTD